MGVRVVLNPWPLEGKPRYLPAGTTDSEGNFRLSSYTTDDGAPAGEYVVTLEWPTAKEANEDDSVNHSDRLKGRYANPAKSNWKVTIKDGANTLDTLEIK